MSFLASKSHCRAFKIFLSISLFSVIFSVFPFREAFAVRTTYESFISTDAQKIQFIGDSAGAQFGSALAKADFNGDGFEDLVVGSPFSSIGMKDWNGKVSIIYGKDVFKSKTFDLKKNSADVSIFGEYSGDQFGTSLAVGDFNGDDLPDLAVGAYNASSNRDTRPGKVYIFYNQSLISTLVVDLERQSPDILFIGSSDGDNFGLALEVSDLNRDAADDLLVGAPKADAFGIQDCGAVYGFYGIYLQGFKYPLHDLRIKRSNISFYGKASGEKFGSEIEVSDLNNDNKKEVLVGAYGYDSDELVDSGRVYLFKPTKIDEKFTFPAIVKDSFLTFEGISDKGWFGFAMDSADVNGDGIDDLAITSFPYNSGKNTGKVSVFYGGRKFLSDSNIVIKEDSRNLSIESPVTENFLGASVLLDDFNGDGRGDIVAGAPGIGSAISEEEGDVYMVYSMYPKLTSVYSIENQDITSTIHGENADDWFGYSISSLDFNGDGVKDLAVGSRYSEGYDSINNGKVFVLLGNRIPYGQAKEVVEPGDRYVNRGEFISQIVEKFDVKNKKADLISDCYLHLEFCLFNFMAMSSYDKIQLVPDLILFPDIAKSDEYYESVNIGAILGLLNGFTNEEGSPFHPEKPITRIQALKVILGLNDLVKPKYRFELIAMLGSYNDLVNQYSYFSDINAKISAMWWYPRYANFAYERGIVDNVEYFRPDDNITVNELNDMIGRTLKLINPVDEETVPSGNPQN